LHDPVARSIFFQSWSTKGNGVGIRAEYGEHAMLDATSVAAIGLERFIHPLEKMGMVACLFSHQFSVILVASGLRNGLAVIFMPNRALFVMNVCRRAFDRKSFG